MTTHLCNTAQPTKPCCWAARRRELDVAVSEDDQIRAVAGGLHCMACGHLYDDVADARGHASECDGADRIYG